MGQTQHLKVDDRTFRRLLSLVRIEHTLLALPPALTGAILAERGLPGTRTLLLTALAFAAARTCAMAFNRLVDRDFDALNPRTSNRELPMGLVRVAGVRLLTIGSALVFFLTAWGLNDLCLVLSPIALMILLGYSYTKRFTWLCHLFLGVCLGLAPVAGWLAVTATFAWVPVILGLGVVFWVAGFDIIYACQDVDFDREAKLHSLPARFGPTHALRYAAVSHVLAFGLFVLTGIAAELGWLFYLFILITGWLLLYEHRPVRPTDLTYLDPAFFKVNSLVSASLLLSVSIGLMS
ncbi:MAG: UbiA-like polyprenyltransferase [Desulfomonilaceae bacterium]|nr:UbiA-like polyprenyltransferase [Desulfomonilaceae bacterium]